jgi:hypothetical protein
MTDLPKKIDELRKAVDRVERILKCDVVTERERPNRYAHLVANLSISGHSYGSHPDPDAVKAAEQVKAAATNVERVRGETERDAGLFRLACELESLRAILYGLAADACIEIGCVARAIKEEAK